MPDLANPVTADEITDVYSNLRVPLQDRRGVLQTLRQEMVGRNSADLRNHTRAIIAKIDEGLSYLTETGDGFADPDSTSA